MKYQDKLFNLRVEIVTDIIKNLVCKYGFLDGVNYCLDCWHFSPVGYDMVICFALYNPVMGLSFEMENGDKKSHSELPIDVLASIADTLSLEYR